LLGNNDKAYYRDTTAQLHEWWLLIDATVSRSSEVAFKILSRCLCALCCTGTFLGESFLLIYDSLDNLKPLK